MKLSTYDRVKSLVYDRRTLQDTRRGAESQLIRIDVATVTDCASPGSGNGPLGAVHFYDDTFSAAIRPGILAELDRRLEANAKALADLGVEVD